MTKLVQDELLSKMSLLSDEPGSSRDFFNFEEYANQISTLLKSKTMISPFTIAIHADWGMGKTTLLHMIMQKFDNHVMNEKIIEFNAWEYERSDIITSLLLKIKNALRDEDKNALKKFGENITTFVIDVALRRSVNMNINEVKEHFSNQEQSISTLRETLEKLTKNTKLIIFIDDLDRCLADNILDMLEAVKMFFNVKNIIVVMAIDITKIERAWELRYDSKIGKIEGREHVEKLFPLKLALPPKLEKDLLPYVKSMASSLADTDIEFILHNSQFNPRKIKRMLNLLYVILLNLPKRGASNEEINKNFEIDFKMLIAWVALTLNHPNIAKKIQLSPSYLIRISIVCNKLKYLSQLRSFLDIYDNQKAKQTEWGIEEITIHRDIISKEIYELLRDVESERESFKIINHFADQFNLELDKQQKRFIMNKLNVEKIDSQFYEPLNEIIKRSGLIGI